MRIIFAILLVLFSSSAYASTTISAQVIRNQTGTGETFISSGFPFPPGLVTEAMITGGLIKVIVNGSEVAANVTGLRGRHSDGTLRSALIQFTVANMAKNDVISTDTSVIVDGGARASADPTYVRPTLDTVYNNNVILATSPTYLSSTKVTFQTLLPETQGTAEEEKQYTALADYGFDALNTVEVDFATGGTSTSLINSSKSWGDNTFYQGYVRIISGTGFTTITKYHYISSSTNTTLNFASSLGFTPDSTTQYELYPPKFGSANYEEVRGMLNIWARTGDIKYYNRAVNFMPFWISFNTPSQYAYGGVRLCYADEYVNPDNRSDVVPEQCGWEISEAYFSRTFSYASMYLLTGYRDFWSIVDYLAQAEQDTITSQSAAITQIPYTGSYDYPRYNYSVYYGAMLPAFLIDATMPMRGNYISATTYNWANQLQWTVDTLKANEWNIKWIPYNTGSGNVPSSGTTITQGEASATLLTVGATMNDSMSAVGAAMPTSGYIMVSGSSVSGTFAAGALTFSGATPPSATATGTAVADTRNGMVGVRPNSIRTNPIGIPYFQLIFPLNFLIDYYLNVDADSRIPDMVKANVDIILNGIKPLVSGDRNYGETSVTWGNYYWGQGYPAENPVDTDMASGWSLAEYPRMIAFVLKTVAGASSMTVNGASYATWYSRLVDTAGNHDVVKDAWKNFGQFYGFGSDAPWIMAQSSLPAPTYREPIDYTTIPNWNGAPPDLARTGDSTPSPGNKWKISSITDDQQ